MPSQQHRLLPWVTPCFWVERFAHVTHLSYVRNNYPFISLAILFKLELMKFDTDKSGFVLVNAACEDMPRAAILGTASGAAVVMCPPPAPSPCNAHSVTQPVSPPCCHTSVYRTSARVILQAALVWAQSTIHSTTHPVIRATSCLGNTHMVGTRTSLKAFSML